MTVMISARPSEVCDSSAPIIHRQVSPVPTEANRLLRKLISHYRARISAASVLNFRATARVGSRRLAA